MREGRAWGRAQLTTLSGVSRFAQEHPVLFSGVWFALSALLLVLPLAAMILLMLALEALGGRPVGAYLSMFFASVVLPLVPSFGMGALAGPRIVRLPANSRGRAAGWGAAAALGALVLWALLLEGIPRLLGSGMQSTGGGDVPGAAVVVGYMVVLPLIVGVFLLVGTASGVLLHALVARGQASGMPVEDLARALEREE